MSECFSVSVRNQCKRYRISISRLQTITEEILRTLGVKQASLDLLLVSDSVIRTRNKKFLGHDWATDVISFGEMKSDGRWTKDEGRELNGNIIISLDTTKRQAREYGNDFFYELCFYLCHGILHILGWDDNTAAKRNKMWKKQAQILKNFSKVQ